MNRKQSNDEYLLYLRDVAMLDARDDYFERINWNRERQVRFGFSAEEDLNLDMFYEMTESH